MVKSILYSKGSKETNSSNKSAADSAMKFLCNFQYRHYTIRRRGKAFLAGFQKKLIKFIFLRMLKILPKMLLPFFPCLNAIQSNYKDITRKQQNNTGTVDGRQ